MSAPVAPTTVEITKIEAGALQAAPRPRRISARAAILIGVGVLWLLAFALAHGQGTDTLPMAALNDVHGFFDAVKNWVADNRSSNVVLLALDGVRVVVNAVVQALLALLAATPYGLGYPEIGWLGSVLLFGWIAWVFGNVRVALLTVGFLVVIGVQGLYLEAMQTLAITLAAVFFSLLIGIPVGIWTGRSRRVERVLTPVLDFMQTMPTFVYLAPLALIFLIGPAAAVIATLIYAAPPVIRLTAHGVRDIPESIDESVASLGATPRQRLRTVVLPLARTSIVLGINQTTMAALSMVTIAALIAAPGLGQVVVQALQSLNVGRAFNAGLAVVLLAIVLDRVTTAIGRRADPAVVAARRTAAVWPRRIAYAVGAVIVIVGIVLSRSQLWAAVFPRQIEFGDVIESAVNAASAWVNATIGGATSALQEVVTTALINPLQALLEQSPIVVVMAAFTVIAFTAGRWALAGGTLAGMLVVWLLGVWGPSMVTLASTLVATALTVAIALVVGVWMGRVARVDAAIRPILDAAQTMPAFVYLVPFLGLFGPNRFTAIVAAVIYAAPIAIKIIADAIRQLPDTLGEVALSTGSSPWQDVTKVQLPMIRHAITLAVNQALIYVLAMVVIGGLVGGGGLGYLVVAGFVQVELFGKGLAAGLAIVIWGMLLDRTTQAFAHRAPRASTAPAAPARRLRRSTLTRTPRTATA
ncbi:ABC transporter permease subunit [Microbacterium trichothecenolyticum]|uniref:Glycine betaine/proline transport system permease protein n=1 Tax=Microbacterium trichothecenolyticum TaxID=69370 RepID=A0ABU0TYL1_MICTR|nr:ABC transporter permease subunit [Microbacterium trichothecenolyticum]MDQ1124747.1 glycine betaine/proline transport system permease protein [Microbacterium trichothecenolyticum]